ncbi:DUF2892 domain-containing protein [Chitinophaga sp. SYP-B3965]|uniref:SRPBCC family protein n=1 Tax=Chitinophaga sp. SYP-B3965 TaxID=2663120 RepID=UPI00129987B5|nr:SRPBCC family protein [Chitinophaga sp. SYP-B3965]MRG44582.1 DUF2892 domain-containing protein [Chitinophaga sp. SYP-B3965]
MEHDINHPRPESFYDSSTVINVSKTGRMISSAAGASLLYLACANFSKSPLKSLGRMLAGGYLLYRGISGNCPVSAMVEDNLRPHHARAVNIRTKFNVNRPRNEVYAYWRQLDHLPAFMAHLYDVEVIDERHSHWTVKLVGGFALEWDAEIVEDEENEVLAWRSTEGADISNAGKIIFRDAPDGGTELHVTISYRPPAGYVGAGLARLLNPAFASMVKNDVRNFKNYVEGKKKKKIANS